MDSDFNSASVVDERLSQPLGLARRGWYSVVAIEEKDFRETTNGAIEKKVDGQRLNSF